MGEYSEPLHSQESMDGENFGKYMANMKKESKRKKKIEPLPEKKPSFFSKLFKWKKKKPDQKE